MDFLQFSKTDTPAEFTFTTENALQLVDRAKTSKKCITRTTDKQLILTDNCTLDQWDYNSTNRRLQDMTAPDQECLSPLDFRNKQPSDLNFATGLLPCSHWNKMVLHAGEHCVYLSPKNDLLMKLAPWYFKPSSEYIK